jgi:hypothetical protein
LTRQIPWLRVFVEGVVIVGSILLAFGIQAWWDERQDRLEEQRLLANVHADFIETREIIGAAVAGHRVRMREILALAEFGRAPESLRPPTFDPPQRIIGAFTGVTTTYPKTGALDGALASGCLDLVSNSELRSALAEWPRTLSEFTEQQTWTWDLVLETRPVIAASVPIADLLLTAGVFTGYQPPDPVYTDELIDFLTSDAGRNYSVLRAQAEGFSIRDGEIVLTAINSLLELLEEEMN